MTLNEKIHMIRLINKLSQAELAFKSGFSINDIISFESNGTIINAYAFIQILRALEMTVVEFEKYRKKE